MLCVVSTKHVAEHEQLHVGPICLQTLFQKFVQVQFVTHLCFPARFRFFFLQPFQANHSCGVWDSCRIKKKYIYIFVFLSESCGLVLGWTCRGVESWENWQPEGYLLVNRLPLPNVGLRVAATAFSKTIAFVFCSRHCVITPTSVLFRGLSTCWWSVR